GTKVVAPKVMNQVDNHASTVVRLNGADRYATGVKISKKFNTRANTVYLASGLGFADALSGGVLAASKNAPVLLSRTTKLPPSVVRQLKQHNPPNVVLLGGGHALRTKVKKRVESVVPRATVSRINGKNRYATAANIAEKGPNKGRVLFTNGSKFADAVAGVPAADARSAPLLLTR